MYISRMKGGAIMANTYALNAVYNHFLTSYAPKSASPFDAHKKSELRSVYNNIVKINKEAPLAILDTKKETKEFAVSIKEEARSLGSAISSMGGLAEADVLSKRKAYSSQEELATAKYIGELVDGEEPKTLELSVKSLAGPQVNTGDYLPSSKKVPLENGIYSFDISVSELNYEFQFSVSDQDTNLDVQERLSRLISNSGIGINAEVAKDEKGNSALKLTSTLTGIPKNGGTIFSVSDERTSKQAGMVDYLGIGDITRYPENALFTVNGMERSASSNHFTVEKTYEVTLQGVSSSPDMTTEIGLKTDTESITENINSLVRGYNDFLNTAKSFLESQPKSSRLLGELKTISSYYRNDLEKAGINIEQDGNIRVDNSELQNVMESEQGEEALGSIKDFANTLLRKSSQVSIDPMNYVNKTIVAYKNPGKSFTNPYITSQYSGMMFNSYC